MLEWVLSNNLGDLFCHSMSQPSQISEGNLFLCGPMYFVSSTDRLCPYAYCKSYLSPSSVYQPIDLILTVKFTGALLPCRELLCSYA